MSTLSQYSAKTKKPYTGPPRPNLLSHEKTIKEIKQGASSLEALVNLHSLEIEKLKSKLNSALVRIDALTEYLQKRK